MANLPSDMQQMHQLPHQSSDMSRPVGPSYFAIFATLVFVNCFGCRPDTTAESSIGTEAQERQSSPRDEPANEFHLVSVTAESGVNAVYRNGREAGENSILESLGGGAGMVDYDRDGVIDLCFPGGGTLGPDRKIAGLPTTLWRSVDTLRYENVAALAGVSESRFYSHGCAVADYDNDGFGDLLVTGYGGLQLFLNQGDGTFRERAIDAGLDESTWSSSAAWGDFDGDGNLDLYVAHYVNWSWEHHPTCPSSKPGVNDVCGPRDFEPLDDAIYFSNGDGSFRDATREAGLVAGGKGLGVVAADLNDDGRLDIYVANDTTNNFLYLNQGQGVFEEVGLVSGTAVDDRGVPNGSMGIAVFDYDGNLRPDLWVTNYENETFALYRNESHGNFLSVSEAAGITVLGGLYVGFGTVATDLDLDGDEDIVVANGHVIYHPKSHPGPQESILLRNDGGGRFMRVTFPPDSVLSQPHYGRGLASGDLDGNGTPDLAIANTAEPAELIVNKTQSQGGKLVTSLVGTRSNRDGIGTRMILETTAGKLFRTIVGGGSYLSESDRSQIWALPPSGQIKQLSIRWPNGIEQQVTAHQLERGRGVVVEPTIDASEPRRL